MADVQSAAQTLRESSVAEVRAHELAAVAWHGGCFWISRAVNVMSRSIGVCLPAALLGGAGCASLGLRGGDLMSAEGRASMARAESVEARIEHDGGQAIARYRDLYPTQPPGCGVRVADGCAPAWTMTVSPTEAELSDAAVHLARSRRQRAELPALSIVEAQACAGVSPGDRDMSPLERRRDIARVDEVAGGAAVLFASVPGLTVVALQDIVACHLARDAVLASDRRSAASCPLSVEGAVARAYVLPRGLVVEVTASDAGAAREIARRARALTRPPLPAPLVHR
jgi:hypothetical protein